MPEDILLKDMKVHLWLANYKDKPNTRNAYLIAMRMYSNFTKKTPTAMINEAKSDIRAGKFMDERAVFADLILFAEHLSDQKLAPKTQALRLAAIKSFYSCHYVETPKLKKGKVKPLEKNKAIPTKQDLQDVLKASDLLSKAIVLTGVSSGLGSNEIKNLKIKTFKAGYDPVTEIGTLTMRREKTDVDFITFLTPETTRAINDYLAYRSRTIKGRDPKREFQLAKQRVTSDDGYLFILQNVPIEYLQTHDEELRKITRNAFEKLYNGLSTASGKNTTAGNWNLIRSHNMRKYFNSALLNAGADSFFVEFLMGHELDATRAAYFRANPDKLKELYKKFMSYLTIQPELDVSTNPEFRNAIEERDHYKALAEKYFIDGLELIKAKQDAAELKELRSKAFKALSKEEQKQELIKSLQNMTYIAFSELKPDATPEEKAEYEEMVAKEKEHTEKMIKARDTALQILQSK